MTDKEEIKKNAEYWEKVFKDSGKKDFTAFFCWEKCKEKLERLKEET